MNTKLLMVIACGLTLGACASNMSDSGAQIERADICQAPPVVPALGPAIVQNADLAQRHTLASGEYFTCAITADRRVACWNLGVLYTDCSAPLDATKTRIVPGVEGVVALSAGNSHVCALRQDGVVLCWGDNAENNAVSAPTLVPMLSQVNQIASGHAHNCAHTIYGDVACWGDNSKDQLGTQLLGIEASSTPIVVPLINDTTSLALNRSRSCVVEQDGNVTCWGDRASVPVPVKGISSVTQLAANAFYMCALKRDGKVMCWGQVPGGPSLSAPTSVNNLSGVAEIAAGPGHACARKSSGSVECWGANTFHQLGTGIQRSLLDTARGEVFGLTDAEELSLGAAHSCARSRSQGVVCWGSAFGSSTPIRVEGL